MYTQDGGLERFKRTGGTSDPQRKVWSKYSEKIAENATGGKKKKKNPVLRFKYSKNMEQQ